MTIRCSAFTPKEKAVDRGDWVGGLNGLRARRGRTSFSASIANVAKANDVNHTLRQVGGAGSESTHEDRYAAWGVERKKAADPREA